MRPLPLAGFALLTLAAPALALECPIPAQIDNAATSASVAKVLTPGIDLQAPNAVEAAIFDLKQAGVPEDIILDNLVASYCQTVAAESGLSEDQKSQKLETFSKSTEPLVFSDAPD